MIRRSNTGVGSLRTVNLVSDVLDFCTIVFVVVTTDRKRGSSKQGVNSWFKLDKLSTVFSVDLRVFNHNYVVGEVRFVTFLWPITRCLFYVTSTLPWFNRYTTYWLETCKLIVSLNNNVYLNLCKFLSLISIKYRRGMGDGRF